MYRVGVMVSCECGAAVSRQLHLHSTCIQVTVKSAEWWKLFKPCALQALYQAKALKPREVIKLCGAINDSFNSQAVNRNSIITSMALSQQRKLTTFYSSSKDAVSELQGQERLVSKQSISRVITHCFFSTDLYTWHTA